MPSCKLKEVLGERLKTARSVLGLTQKELCAATGLPVPSLRGYELSHRIPGGDAIEMLVGIGINANWLLTGEGPMLLADITQGGVATEDRVDVPIPNFSITGKDGQEVEIASEVASLALDRQWLEQRGLRPIDLISIRMPDNSMEPTIREGSLLVVDSSTNKLRGDGIYCLMYEGNIAVKRLQMDFSGGLLVCGDNPTYKDQRLSKEAAANLNVHGKVIWSGGVV